MKDIDKMLFEIIKYNIDECDNEISLVDDTNIFKEYDLDSIQIINIISDIEMAFSIYMTMDQNTMDALQRYGALKAYIHEKIEIEEVENA